MCEGVAQPNLPRESFGVPHNQSSSLLGVAEDLVTASTVELWRIATGELLRS